MWEGLSPVTASSKCKCVDVSICTMYNLQCVDMSICNMLVCYVQWTKCSVLMWEGLRRLLPPLCVNSGEREGCSLVLTALHCNTLKC